MKKETKKPPVVKKDPPAASSASSPSQNTRTPGKSIPVETATEPATRPAQADAASAQPDAESTPAATAKMPEADPNPDSIPEEEVNADAAPETNTEASSGRDAEAEPGSAFPADDLIGDQPRLQLFTPSSLYEWGQMEIKFFQQIYTQTRFWDGNGDAIEQGNRSTYYSGIGNILFGVNKRINLGLDFWLQSVHIDGEETSPFKIMTFPSTPNSRTALTTIGPKVKFQPFPELNGLTIQSAFLIPIASDPEGRSNGRPFLATENYISWTQIFYTHNFSAKWQLFAQLDFYWNINRGEGNGFFATPASAFLSYFPTRKITVYLMNQFWPTYREGLFSSHWYQAGLGGKVQLGQSLDLELMYGRFLFGSNAAGPAQAFNLGLRFVKW